MFNAIKSEKFYGVQTELIRVLASAKYPEVPKMLVELLECITHARPLVGQFV